MKKLFFALSVITLTGLLFSFATGPNMVYADQATESTVFKACKPGPDGLGVSDKQACQSVNANNSFELIGPTGIITRVAQVIVWLIGIVAVLMIILGGFRYVISGGDQAGISSAKNTILYAVVGLVIAMLAQVIVSFVLSNL